MRSTAMRLLGFLLSIAATVSAPAPGVADDWCPGFGPDGFDHLVHASTTFGTDLVVAGLFSANGSLRAPFVARWDGSQWVAMGDPSTTASGIFFALSACEFNNALYLGTFRNYDEAILLRWNGSAWAIVDQPIGNVTHGQITSMLAYDGMLVVAGDFTGTPGQPFNGSVVGWNGANWVTLGDPPDFQGSSIIYSGLAEYGGDLYVAGRFTDAGGAPAHSLARWDGLQWTSVDGYANAVWKEGIYNGTSTGAGYALAVYDGRLVIGGAFDHAGDLAVSNLVAWDGATQAWESLGNAGSGVYSLSVSGGNLIAGGTFTTVGGTPASHIARFDGVTWAGLTSGVSGTAHPIVYTTLDYGSDLVVGGNFNSAGGERHPYLATWDGSSFHGMENPGLGTDDDVAAMVEYDGKLIVGGRFTEAGSEPIDYLAAWLGSGWQVFEGGANAPIHSLYADGTDLYAGGEFTSIGSGSNPFSYFARWNGDHWQYAGGAPTVVEAITVHNGDLYIGGYDFLQKWLGSSWQTIPFPAGTPTVYALASFDNKLVVAGNEILQAWDGSLWTPIVGGMPTEGVDGDVHCLAVWNGWLYIGGSFYYAAGVSSDGLARWDGAALESMGSNLLLDGVYGMTVEGDVLYTTGYGGPGVAWLANGAPNWSTVDNGWASGLGNAIAAHDGNIYAGGNFDRTVNDMVDRNFARICSGSATAVRGPVAADGLDWTLSPNPFNPWVMIRFEIADATSRVDLRIFDVQGRLVRHLVAGRRPAGVNTVSWDGRNDRGVDVASGVYFAQLQIGSTVDTKKAVLVR